jgi:phage recombination protein Bet
MNNVVALQPLRPRDYTGAQLALVRRTVAKDCNDDEFNLFVEAARRIGLDPFRKQIYALVHNKNKPDKRQLTIITGIDGFRSVAARNGDYRPDSDEPYIEYDDARKDPATNPLGIVKAVVKCWKRDDRSGEWYAVAGTAYWDEFAPVEEEWGSDGEGGRRPTGRKKLRGNWPNMARVMIAKCAEAQALRKGWPEDLSGVYAPEEMSRAEVIEATASEIVAQADQENRMKLIGAANSIPFMFAPGEPIQMIPAGQVADRVLAFIRQSTSPTQIDAFRETNRAGLQEFWALHKADALELKKAIEARIAELEKA